MNLSFNPQTKQQLDALSASMPHAVVLVGVKGVGLLTAAKHLANSNIADIIEPLDKDGVVNHKKGTISVKRIRELYDESKGKSLTERIFIIDDADMMSTGAQNAFLKLLEEPSSRTHFILTSHNPAALLPTVTSRTERVNVLPISDEESKDLAFTLKLRGVQESQALFIAAGKPAELARLAASTEYFEQAVAIMSAAKSFVSGGKKAAVITAFHYATNREQALALLDASKNLLLHASKTTPSAELIERLAKCNAAYDAIYANGNTKLHLVAAMV